MASLWHWLCHILTSFNYHMMLNSRSTPHGQPARCVVASSPALSIRQLGILLWGGYRQVFGHDILRVSCRYTMATNLYKNLPYRPLEPFFTIAIFITLRCTRFWALRIPLPIIPTPKKHPVLAWRRVCHGLSGNMAPQNPLVSDNFARAIFRYTRIRNLLADLIFRHLDPK